MQVSEILKQKGRDVFTAHPEDTVQSVIGELLSRKIGAAVVVDRRGKVEGVISERDIVYGIGRRGDGALALPVRELMTSPAPTCRADDDVTDIMSMMTHRRARHLAVVDRGGLCGIVSIGDVVKHRLDEIQLEVKVLRDYARSSVR